MVVGKCQVMGIVWLFNFADNYDLMIYEEKVVEFR